MEEMRIDNIIQHKTFSFAVRIVNTYKYLIDNKREFTLSKQLLRSGTSIGANVEESLGGQSKKDFFYKINIAYKEARETRYWIKLLVATNFLSEFQGDSLLNDCNEICKILAKILITISKE